ncbi:MAG TPA: cytochrome c oxidase subunit II [Thermoanaerobaculia bacterium]|nr:cytochrome c oxidase subunit II [Thermoanaerobaculia bacterium]
MPEQLPLFPDAASSLAREVDALFVTWSLIAAFFTLLIAVSIVYFMVRYRRQSEDEVGLAERAPVWLETVWSIVPLAICLVMFGWGARVFYKLYRPPADAVEYWAVGKQWMWKFQHPQGNREINSLHVPVGRAVRLTMTSEDVIHSFFVPEFRTKQDVLPGRYVSVWFRATKAGTYKLFCTEYCGTEHSHMIGRVVALAPQDYEQWLAGGAPGRSMAESGAALFQSLACDTCHREGAGGRVARAPALEGTFGNQVALAGGQVVIADENYLRESILQPAAKVVAGWNPIMPTYQGQVSEEQLNQLIAYLKTLGETTGEVEDDATAP